ncbi:MAG TPA: helix-hairpin-helix domain-containing protein, partial [Bacteroidia bacterium]|nr:helix-hairpin-helix domain-containing protein [Bacteroidia bacterium]
MKAIFILAIGFIQVAPLFGQTKIKEDIPVVLENNMESMVASNTSADDNLDVLEVMNEYSHSALNINQATLETLEQFPLLTEIQANAIIEHRNKFGKFRCVEELQVLNEFTLEDIRKILPFISVGSITPGLPLSLKNLVSEAEQSLTLRWQRSLGPQISTTETTRNYGDPTKLFAKYKYRFADRLRLGITAEKDPGEGFFSGKQQNGFDFYSAYLQWQQKGLIQKIILGDYTVQFGQGLVMWSGFGFGKSAETILIKRSAKGTIPYTSADENNFF